MNEYLPVATLLRLLAALLLAFAPHVSTLPPAISAGIAALVAWRGLAAYRQWRMPPKVLRAALALAAFAAVYASYGRVSGQTAGTALLCVMTALKLVELRERRDVLVLVSLMYFALFTHFLHSQAPWTVLYLLASAVATTALLIEVQHRETLPLRTSLRLASRLIAQALPLMLLLFVLFPRIPGPLWGLPADSGAARTGLSDSMTPGDISNLIESEELAFRVRFLDREPVPSQRYWRGPVLDRFDGRTWTRGVAPRLADPQAALPDGEPLRYEVTYELQRLRLLPVLEQLDVRTAPEDAALLLDGELALRKPMLDRRRLVLGAFPQQRLEPLAGLEPRRRAAMLQLPRGFNPRAQALAQQWREQHGDDAAIVQAALQMFRQQAFRYTLRPPLLGRDSVDDFLFRTRAGFCEHYSSSFTVLMRAAGVPARVVTGYQGGSYNTLGGFFSIQQSDAHAWSEVWLANRGWVRIDPTAAVAAERVERGLGAAMPLGEGLPAHLLQRQAWRDALKLRWDLLQAQWDGLVLGYGPELQQDFLRRFGLDDLRSMILALTAGVTTVLALIGAVLLYRSRPAPITDPAQRLWLELLARLARKGLKPRPGEGPRDFSHRVGLAHPAWRPALDAACARYLESRYLQQPTPQALEALRRAIRAVTL